MRKNPWNDPKYRAKMLKKRKEAAARPEVKEKQRLGMLRAYKENPKLAADKADTTRKMWQSLSKKKLKQMSRVRSIAAHEQNERQWADPKYRAKMLKVRKEQANRPEEIQKNKQRVKALWENPKYRAKQMAARAASDAYRIGRIAKISDALIGKPSWNTGLTKDTHPALAKMSADFAGRIPNWGKYPVEYKRGRKVVAMRSTWEVAYAKFLDKQGIKWQYEPRWFNIGKGPWRGISYTPDFYLPATDTYTEVKGYLSKLNATKITAFRNKYPEVKLDVLQKKELLAAGVKLGGT